MLEHRIIKRTNLEPLRPKEQERDEEGTKAGERGWFYQEKDSGVRRFNIFYGFLPGHTNKGSFVCPCMPISYLTFWQFFVIFSVKINKIRVGRLVNKEISMTLF